jgi:hypothetical protein
MPLQNRVTPLGDLVAVNARGLVYGNRGCLHDDAGRLRRRYNGKRWIACRLRFRGWHRSPLMQPGRFTELFFLDEATAFAAGHRPCALCRRQDYVRFIAVWSAVHGTVTGADAVDARLHAERVDARTRRHLVHDAPLDGLPDGSFVLVGESPLMVFGRELLLWTPGGYTERRPRPAKVSARLITPPSLVAVLRTGWEPLVSLFHPTATGVSAESAAILAT